MLQEVAPAKINLALHVRRRRDDGYHDLESLFVFARDGDMLTATIASSLTLTIDGPFAAGLSVQDNLVLRAAAALQRRANITTGAAITLNKRLPVAAGLGGGSADAAAALRLLARLWEVDENIPVLSEIAIELGSDVPACLYGRPVIGKGRGERLEAYDSPELEGQPILLVNPRIALATPPVFKAWDGIDRGGLVECHGAMHLALKGRNDLELPARTLAPVIGDMLEACAKLEGVGLVRMSGSGATCFALFDSDTACTEGARMINARYPAWWTLATTLGA